MQDLQKRLGLTFLFISHNLAVVRQIADRIAVMYLGRIVETAATDELFARPRHPYTQALLSAVPIADPDERRQRILLSGDVPSPFNPPGGCRFHPRCPLAEPPCRSVEPQASEVSDSHEVACYVAARTVG